MLSVDRPEDVRKGGLLSDSHQRICTSDPERAYAAIRQVYSDAKWQFQGVHQRSQPIVMHGTRFGHFGLSTISYGRALSIQATGDDSVLIVAGVLAGRVSFSSSHQSFDGTTGSVAVMHMNDESAFRYDEEGCTYKLGFKQSRVESLCRKLMDRPGPGRLVFDLRMASESQRLSWTAHARMLAGFAGQAAASGGACGSAALAEEMLITSLLYGQPHSFSEALQRAAPQAAPRHVKRAVSYIHENLEEEITLESLANAAGCSMRSLHRTFKAAYDASPMQYLREVRLRQARQRLMDIDSEHRTITEIAASCGFMHMGAFAAHYKTLFGEAPHQTRRGQ